MIDGDALMKDQDCHVMSGCRKAGTQGFGLSCISCQWRGCKCLMMAQQACSGSEIAASWLSCLIKEQAMQSKQEPAHCAQCNGGRIQLLACQHR